MRFDLVKKYLKPGKDAIENEIENIKKWLEK
jgi:hypothetical protein